jgi:hypothetical protein
MYMNVLITLPVPRCLWRKRAILLTAFANLLLSALPCQALTDCTDLPPIDILKSLVQVCITSGEREAYSFWLMLRIVVDDVGYESSSI